MSDAKPESFFPELEGEEQRLADEWLHDYLRLVIRIHRESIEADADAIHSSQIDVPRGTGKLCTADLPGQHEQPS